MSGPPVAAAPASTTAIAAFLRGVGRRAVVYAELQGAGDADIAVAAAVRLFRNVAPSLDLPRWPHAFWSGLVNAPALRGAGPDAPEWARIPAASRAALLLRLAAGLDDSEAARVLGVDVPVYQQALQRALAAARVDAAALQAQLQQRIAAVSAERVERLTLARAADAPAARGRANPQRRPLLALLWSLLLLCVAGFAMTFRWPLEPQADEAAQAGPWGAPLPPAAAPASRFDPEAARIVHRDFALLVDADAAPFVRDLEFYSWLAAQDAGPVPPAGPLVSDEVVEPSDAPGLETDDALL